MKRNGKYVYTAEKIKRANYLHPQEAVYILRDYLLGEDYYIVDSISEDQANAVVVEDILKKYSSRFNKELRKLEYKQQYPNGREIRLFGLTINIKKEKRK